MADDLASLQAAFAAAVRDYVNEPAASTALLRRAAEINVEIRSRFENSNGDVDWRGTSWGFRSAISDAYGMAGLLVSERKQAQDAMRYHTSIVLRARLSRDELINAGLMEQSSRQRSAEQKTRERAVVASARTSSNRDNPVRALGLALRAISGFKAAAVRSLPDEQKADLVDLAAAICKEAERLARAAKPRKR